MENINVKNDKCGYRSLLEHPGVFSASLDLLKSIEFEHPLPAGSGSFDLFAQGKRTARIIEGEDLVMVGISKHFSDKNSAEIVEKLKTKHGENGERQFVFMGIGSHANEAAELASQFSASVENRGSGWGYNQILALLFYPHPLTGQRDVERIKEVNDRIGQDNIVSYFHGKNFPALEPPKYYGVPAQILKVDLAVGFFKCKENLINLAILATASAATIALFSLAGRQPMRYPRIPLGVALLQSCLLGSFLRFSYLPDSWLLDNVMNRIYNRLNPEGSTYHFNEIGQIRGGFPMRLSALFYCT